MTSQSISAAEYRETAKTPSRSKYGAKRVVVDGITFASIAESRRYEQLRILERAGEISQLRLQTRHKLEAWGHPICVYVSDFDYLDRTGTPVTEDVKGVETPAFKIKAKLFRAQMGRAVVVVRGR